MLARFLLTYWREYTYSVTVTAFTLLSISTLGWETCVTVYMVVTVPDYTVSQHGKN